MLRIWLSGRSSSRVPHVFYGQVIPNSNHEAYGGMVKFQRMQSAFPNSPDQFNLLYMVSSQTPLGAGQIARMAQRQGARFVWNQNGVAYPAWHGAGWEITNALMGRLLHSADYVFYQSRFCKTSADRYLGLRQERWEVLYNAVDTEVFTPAASHMDPPGLVLLLGGTQYQYYRLQCAFETLASLVKQGLDAYLIVTGRLCWIPNETKAARTAYRLADSLAVRDRLTFLGPYAQADAPDIMRKAQILLHTKYNDPSPGLVVEAMACGLPVVYSESGGVPELVGKDAGIGVPGELRWDRDVPPDPEALAQAVVEVAQRRKSYAEAARQRAVDLFDLKPWIKRHREVFEELVR